MPAYALMTVALAAAILAADLSSPMVAKSEAAPAPQTVRKGIWGPTSHNGYSMFPIYRDLGVGIYQTMARWDDIALWRPANPSNPNDPAYRWPAYLDRQINEAAAYGMTTLIMILGAPPWANSGRPWVFTPDNPYDYAAFAAAMSKRYPSVRYWMVWGETNRKPVYKPFWGAGHKKKKLNKRQQLAPRNYSKLLDAAYGALKMVNPNNIVIGGNTYTGQGKKSIKPYHWIRYMKLPGGARPRMDMFGHNPSSFRKPNLKSRPTPKGVVEFSDLRRLARVINKNFRGTKLPLFLSEWGLAARSRAQRKPKRQAKWIKAGLRIAERWRRIYSVGWVVPIDRFENRSQLIGLMRQDGSVKPAYFAFKNRLSH